MLRGSRPPPPQQTASLRFQANSLLGFSSTAARIARGSSVTPSGRASEPHPIFEGVFEKGTIDTANYDVTPTHRFVMVQAADASSQQTELHLLLHWPVPATVR